MSRNTKERSMSHRGRFDIIADILEASAEEEVRKTHIMYRCNLSFKQLTSYLGFLLEKGLLHNVIENKESNSDSFEITDKGKRFLKAYKGLANITNRASAS
ncbi:MAG: winged helix-turn-helix domain-containing protein [Candidatus Bathyarchaeota archaeon]